VHDEVGFEDDAQRSLGRTTDTHVLTLRVPVLPSVALSWAEHDAEGANDGAARGVVFALAGAAEGPRSTPRRPRDGYVAARAAALSARAAVAVLDGASRLEDDGLVRRAARRPER